MIITEVQILQTGPPGPNTVAGLIAAGANVSFDGDGTPASPLVISATSGGGGGGSGTVESVAITGAGGISFTGSPITTSGTFAMSIDAAALRTTLGVADAPTSGNATSGQTVLGNDTRLTDARTPTSHTHTLAEVANLDEVINYDALNEIWTFSPTDISARDCVFESVTFSSGVDGEGGDIFFNSASYSYGSAAKAAAHRDALGLDRLAIVTHTSGTLTLDATNCGPSKYIRNNTGTDDIAVTVVTGMPEGTSWIIRQTSLGKVGPVTGSGLTVNGESKTSAQHTEIMVIVVSEDPYMVDVIGGVA
jgi:hypothetical protein